MLDQMDSSEIPGCSLIGITFTNAIDKTDQSNERTHLHTFILANCLSVSCFSFLSLSLFVINK